MGDACSPENLEAVISASGQAKGIDPFREAQRLKELSATQKAYYELTMADILGVKPGKEKQSVWAGMTAKAEVSGDPKSVFDDRLYIHPSKQFAGGFWNSIKKKTDAWLKAEKPNYKEQVGKPARQLLAAIDKTITESKTSKELAKRLKPFGLRTDNVYDARDLLDWMAKGGPTQKGRLEPLKAKAGAIARAQANWNLLWTMGNGPDMLRVASHYVGKSGLKTFLGGVADAHKASGGNVFKRIPGLADEGVYDTSYLDREGGNNDPFNWSITAQKNLTYHIDKRAGGNGLDGIRDQLFDVSSPFDQPRAFRGADAGLIFGLVRFPINEARWVWGTSKAALMGDKEAAKTMFIYNVTKALAVGSASLLPAPLWAGLPKDYKDAWNEWDKEHKLNLIKIVTNVDLSNYTRFGGGSLGARLSSVGQTGSNIFKFAAKAGIDVAEGKLPAAAANAIASGIALANFGSLASAAEKLSKVTPIAGKLVGSALAFEASKFNSTTLGKLFQATGKALEEEFDGGKYATGIAKALFGQQQIKSDRSNRSRHGRPSRPKRAAAG